MTAGKLEFGVLRGYYPAVSDFIFGCDGLVIRAAIFLAAASFRTQAACVSVASDAFRSGPLTRVCAHASRSSSA